MCLIIILSIVNVFSKRYIDLASAVLVTHRCMLSYDERLLRSSTLPRSVITASPSNTAVICSHELYYQKTDMI